jgi:menaquinone-dependent protoporphyrinogen oxidase
VDPVERKEDTMSILVAYATKYGMTRRYAEAMAKEIGPKARVVDLSSPEAKGISLDGFQTVILGASVYAGRARPALGSFISMRAKELAGKKLGLFLCGLAEDGTEAAIEAAFPGDLRAKATATAYLPGWAYPEKMNFAERAIMKMIAKAEAKAQVKAGVAPRERREPNLDAAASAFVKRIAP